MHASAIDHSTWRRIKETFVDIAMAYPGVPSAVGKVAHAIARHIKRHGSLDCWPSTARLASLTGLAERTVRDATLILTRIGLLRRKRRRNRSSILTIVRLEPVEVVAPEAEEVMLVEDVEAPPELPQSDPERRPGAAQNGAGAPKEAMNLNQIKTENAPTTVARMRREAGLCDLVREAAQVRIYREGWRDSTILHWLSKWRQDGHETDAVISVISARSARREPDYFKSIAYFENAVREGT